ncbi:hypothetical protein RAT170B_0212 [Rickettsia argasii T170-B]|uniref:Uncharacterized protein n=1 Tax=Rickettsia argasii T170-B TaxID=1268837 RepID=A0A0F3RG24_9RICK|nr:hypothetical protein RAT170B_0212 [Rickettsia argasii T170-B]
MKIKTYPVSFLWSVIKPYKYWYFVMMLGPIASGFHPIIYNYAVKLLLDLFAQNEKIIFAQSYKPIIWFQHKLYLMVLGVLIALHNLKQCLISFKV